MMEFDSSSRVATSLTPLERGASCAYLAPDSTTGCRAPRSCSSCLETTGCMIDTAGTCVSQVDHVHDPATLSFDRAFKEDLVLPNATATNGDALRAALLWQFPAGRVTYCPTSDAVCRDCRRTNFWRSRNSYPDSRFCVGEDSTCVCIDVCERPWVVKPDCSSNGGFAPAPAPSRAVLVADLAAAQNIWHALVGAVIFAIVALGFLLRARLTTATGDELQREVRRRRQEARRELREARVAAMGVNPLTLSGWAKYRRDLIDKETAQLAGTGVEGRTPDGESTAPAGASPIENHDNDNLPQESVVTSHYVRIHDNDDDVSGNIEARGPQPRATATSDGAVLAPAPTLASASTARMLLAPLTAVPQQPVAP